MACSASRAAATPAEEEPPCAQSASSSQPRRPAQAVTTPSKRDDTARRIEGLSFNQRRAMIQAHVAVGVGNFFRQAAAEPTKATPARLERAAAQVAHEAFPYYRDDENAEFAHRCGGAGYTEMMMALEGQTGP